MIVKCFREGKKRIRMFTLWENICRKLRICKTFNKTTPLKLMIL